MLEEFKDLLYGSVDRDWGVLKNIAAWLINAICNYDVLFFEEVRGARYKLERGLRHKIRGGEEILRIRRYERQRIRNSS